MKAVSYLDNSDFKKTIIDALKGVASLTAQTLGPGGRAILLEQENGEVLATKDGVTVAKHHAKHRAANSSVGNLVVQAAVEASDRTGRSCGDGTTTSLVLAAAIVEAGQEWIAKNPGYSPQRLARELKETYEKFIVPEIQKLARPIKDLPAEEAEKAIWHVAAVSANFDEDIADAVTEASLKAGENGFVIVEEGAGSAKTSVSYQSGFPVNSGLSDLGGSAGAAFVNRKAYGDSVLQGAYVALYDGEISDVETIRPLLERVLNEQVEGVDMRRPLVIVAHGFGDQVLRILAQNFRTGTLSVVPMITPRNGQNLGRQGFLHDLVAFVGGTVFEPTALPLQNASPSNIGFTEEVKIGANNTVFITEPEQADIEKRMKELQEQMENSSEWDKDRIRYRIGALTGGVSTIFAGGATALEAKERRDRVVDAVSAVRSAMELGVVPGGGSTLLHISRQLPQVSYNSIFEQALKRPYTQILMNAGVAQNEPEALFVGNTVGMSEDGKTFKVYDALKRESVEFWESGIFDGAKTVSQSLQNALSVAQLLMTTGGAIALSVSEDEQSIKAMQKGLLQAMNNGDIE